MPSWHDSVTAIFTENPALAIEIATTLNGAPVPPGVPIRIEASGFNDRPARVHPPAHRLAPDRRPRYHQS